MIVDAFPFFNELDVLEIRLAELVSVVDRFLLVEATETYSGKPKPLYFEQNKERFAAYPVEHVIIDRFPDEMRGAWTREYYSRRLMRERLCEMGISPDDILLLSDLDEIPRAEKVAKYARLLANEVPGTIYLFGQFLSYYFVNYRSPEPWYGTRMARWRDIGDLQVLRESAGIFIRNGGWHFSYVGGVGSIQEKLGAFAHTEMDQPQFKEPAHIKRCMAQGADLFGRGETFTCIAVDESFPTVLRENAQRYAHLIRQPREVESAARLYGRAVEACSDISGHLPYLWRLASTVSHVTEMGTRTCQSTSAFIWAKPDRVVAYDIERYAHVDEIAEAARNCGVDFVFHQQDVLQAEIEETDLLFIDTWHVEQQMREELRLHAGKSRRYIVLHDTQTHADLGDTAGMPGIWPAVSDFLREHSEWQVLQHFTHNNGLTVLERAWPPANVDHVLLECDHSAERSIRENEAVELTGDHTGAWPEIVSNPGVRLGIVVSVRNCLKLTQEMLASIRTRHSYSVYIVDDRSDAATKEWLRGQPSIRTFTDPPLSTGVAYNWNLGIAAALQDGCTHFLVVNNDILFHPATIDLMVERIDRGDVALVTAHDVGGTYRDPAQVMELTARIEGEDERPEFFCFSLTEQALKQIGWFDESFAGAYYEDNDYHARIALANLKAVRLLGAPVFHYGTATIRSDRGASAEIGQAAHRNKEYFLHKWGRLPAGDPREMRHAYFPTPFNRPLIYQDAPRQRIQELFECALARQSDISDHIDYLYRLGSSVHRITEFSPGGGQSTCAFLKSWPRSLHVYESDVSPHLELIAIAARLAGIDFLQHREESDTAQIEETDLLFIDTWHIEERMREDLRRHADKVERFIILHDTATFAHSGETAGHRGIWPPISDFLRGHPEWRILQHFPYNNGLTVLARRGGMTSRGESA